MSGSPDGAEKARRAALSRALDYLAAVGVPADEALEAASAALRAAKGADRPLAAVMGELRAGLEVRRGTPPAAREGAALSGLSRQGLEAPGPRARGETREIGAAAPDAPARPFSLDDLALYAGSLDACGLACSMPAILRGHMTPELMDRSPWRSPLQKFGAWLVLTSSTVSNSRLGVAAAHAALIVPPYLAGGML